MRKSKNIFSTNLASALCGVALIGISASAAVPQLINYQGRIAVDGVNFDGTGQFKFALVDATGTTTYWSNDGTSTAGSAPAAAVDLTVAKGLYSVLLGDATLTNMSIVASTVFTNENVHLRVWFDDGFNGSQLLSPDQRIAAVGYAMMAGEAQTVPDGSITSAKLASGTVSAALNAEGQGGVASGAMVLSSTENPVLLNAGYVRIGAIFTTGIWQQRLNGTPSAGRTQYAAVWTGTEMIIWGGYSSPTLLNTGARYDPAANSWTATTTTNAPAARVDHTAVWTGSEMIVWGGRRSSTNLNTGARYDPVANSWTATSTNGAPTARTEPTAIWTGSEMIVWGGWGESSLNTGARYDPVANSWVATTTNGASARTDHTAVWTGSEMIVWGGWGESNLNTGARYDPAANSWTATNATNAPTARSAHSALWTGSEMIVWGGAVDFGSYLDTGARYDPAADSWTATSTNGAPAARYLHTAVWTGSEMIVWGGGNPGRFNTGGRYDPASNRWTATSTTDVPAVRYRHTAVWTGSEMIVWGGLGGGGYLNDTWSYTPGKTLILYQWP